MGFTGHCLDGILERFLRDETDSAATGGARQFLGAVGFALVRDERGHAVHAAAAVGPSAHLSIEFADGRVGATSDADRPQTTASAASTPKAAPHEAKPATPKRVVKPVGQGSLF